MLKSKYADHHAEAERLTSEIRSVTEQRDKEREIYGKSYSAELARSNHYKQQRDRLQKIVDEQCRVSSVCREYREQRDRLAEACKKLMAIIGETNSLIDDYWVSEDEMDEAWNIAEEALQSLTTNEL
jgi:galactokinase